MVTIKINPVRVVTTNGCDTKQLNRYQKRLDDERACTCWVYPCAVDVAAVTHVHARVVYIYYIIIFSGCCCCCYTHVHARFVYTLSSAVDVAAALCEE